MDQSLCRIKIRIKDSFIPLIETKLGSKSVKNFDEVDTYLKVPVKGRAEKISESQGKVNYETVTKEGNHFRIDIRPLTSKDKAALMRKRSVEVVLNKKCSLYNAVGAQVMIDRIEELGTFIVIESENAAVAEQVARKLGFDAPQYVVYPDDILKR